MSTCKCGAYCRCEPIRAIWSKSEAAPENPVEQPLGNSEQLDNSWRERGEFPPVGWKGLVNNGGDTEYFECEVVAYHHNGRPILKTKGSSIHTLTEKPDCWKFCPIKTEREKFQDSALELYDDNTQVWLHAMFNAGFRAPEDGK